MRKAALHNLGCKVNAYETEAMQQLLEKAGYEIVPFQEKADVYIINTCSVTNVADKKSRQMLHRAKKQNPAAAVVAAGCYVQSSAEKLKKDLAVDIIIGNNKKKELVEVLNQWFSQNEKTTLDCMIDIAKTREYEELEVNRIVDHTRAFLKIQDGCNQFCSYCIIPYTRGHVRSRRPEQIVREVETLVKAGYREAVLTGIHLSSYGKDFSETGEGELLNLILQICEVSGLERVRLGSLEPRIITQEFAETLAAQPKFCPHFHLSLQSGCDETLRRMNRHYTTADYAERCKILRAAFKNPAITTDVIVGFPGETEEEFAVSRSFLEQIGFYEMHVFKYSSRRGTRAAQMKEQVPEQIKARRSEVLIGLGKKLSAQYRSQFLGACADVLWEEEIEMNGLSYRIGHTKEYLKAAALTEQVKKYEMSEGVLSAMLTDEIFLLEPR